VGARRLTWLDVFCDGPLRGNQLAVVHDADDLDEPTMLAFARETKLSETTFVQAATREGADYRNRIFDARQELRFAGHPSLGTAVAVARAAGETETSYVQETIAGLQPIDVRLDADRADASMLQEPAVFGPELDPGPALAAAGLDAADLDPQLPVQVVSTGVAQVLVPVREEALARARPDFSAIEPLLDEHEAITLYLAACDPAAGRAHARSFGHTADMGEDPATGSAAGPLMAYLHARAGTERLVIDQGIEMGRPSVLECSVEGDRVRVGGGAAILIEGTVLL
jgi:trans-2,3-dihydro-3-hydroxyanthranilate isomerase